MEAQDAAAIRLFVIGVLVVAGAAIQGLRAFHVLRQVRRYGDGASPNR